MAPCQDGRLSWHGGLRMSRVNEDTIMHARELKRALWMTPPSHPLFKYSSVAAPRLGWAKLVGNKNSSMPPGGRTRSRALSAVSAPDSGAFVERGRFVPRADRSEAKPAGDGAVR